MNIIIPLGGKGERFINEGYTNPKAMIKIFEKTMIEYVLDNLNYNKEDEIFIIYNKKLDDYDFYNFIHTKYHHIKMFSIDDTRGAVETLYEGFRQILETSNYHKKTLLLDCDTFYTDDIISKFRKTNNNACFYTKNNDPEPIYSYIQINDEGNITEIKEKIKISDNANTGCYAFRDINELNNYCKFVLDNNITFNNEPYTSCVISEMIKNGATFEGLELNDDYYFSLGTPIAIDEFIQRTYGFLFDLDGTLVLTDQIYFNVWSEILNTYNIIISKELFKTYIQGNNDEYVNNTLLRNINISTNELSTIKDRLFIEGINKLEVIEGVYDFIKQIKMNGHKICIVTNCNRIVANSIISHIKLEKYIDFTITSSDVVNGKPHKEPYLNTIQKLNIENDKCFIFEDSKSGILSAKQNNPRLLVGIETIYNTSEMISYQVDTSIKNFKNFTIHNLFENKKENVVILQNQISQTLNCDVNTIYFDNMLKGGFIADVNAFRVKNNNGTEHYVVKYENTGHTNDLSIMANKIELYNREYYFYDRISSNIDTMNIPQYFGLINYNDKPNGLILENLFSKNLVPNIKLTTKNIDVSLKIIDNMCKLHAKFWNKDIKKTYPGLKKTNDIIFQPFYIEFITSKYDSFIQKWDNILNEKQKEICGNILNNFEKIQNNLSKGDHTTFIHGDIKSPNIFYDTCHNNEPFFVDWQHCGIGKGVQDLVFFIIESFDIENIEMMYTLFTNYYYFKLHEYDIINYSYDEYQCDLKDALCYVPYFTCMWFGTIPQDELIDVNFPYFLITKLFYLLEKIN